MAKSTGFKGYLSPYLSPQQVDAVKAIASDADAWSELLEKTLELGYKVTVKVDPRAKAFNAVLSTEIINANKGWYLSAYGRSAIRALVAVCYVHLHVAKATPWSETEGLQRQLL